jgi:hypothetical protein
VKLDRLRVLDHRCSFLVLLGSFALLDPALLWLRRERDPVSDRVYCRGYDPVR